MSGMNCFNGFRKLTIPHLSLLLVLTFGHVEAASAEQDSVGIIKSWRPEAKRGGKKIEKSDHKSVFLKDSIQTLERAWVILGLEKGSQGEVLRQPAKITIPDRTKIKIGDLGVRDSFLVEIIFGRVLIVISEQLLGGYVESPTAEVILEPSSITEVKVFPNGDTYVTVLVGAATVEAAGLSRKVKEGEKTVVLPGKPALPPIPVSPNDSSILLQPTVEILHESPVFDYSYFPCF